MLTANTDTVEGTAGNDTINAPIDVINGSASTLNALDSVDGGAGTDTLKIEGAQALTGTIENIEVARYLGDISGLGAGGTITVDASKVGGLEQFWFDAVTIGSDKLVVSNLASEQAVGVKGTMTSGSLDASYAAAATDAVIALDGAAGDNSGNIAVNTLGAGLQTVSVTGSTAKTASVTGSVTLDDSTNNVKTLNLNADSGKSLQVNANALTGLTTINAAAAQGAVDLTAIITADLTITGGAGNDRFDLGGSLTSADKIDGGAGNDTLAVNYANGNIFGTATLTNVKNIETAELKAGAFTATDAAVFDISKVGAANAKVGTLTLADASNTTAESASLAIQGIGNGGTVELAGSLVATTATQDTISTSITVGGAQTRTDDVLNVELGTSTAGVTVQSLAIAEVETVNITSQGGANTVSSLDLGDKTSTLDLSGDKAITISAFAGDDALTTIDASDMTANVIISSAVTLGASASGVTYTGGSKVDTYTASGKGDTITGGAGADVIALAGGSDTVVFTSIEDSTATSKDVISNFTTGVDVLNFDGLLQGDFGYLGTASFNGAGNTEARFANGSSNDLLVDINGDGEPPLFTRVA